MRQVTPEHSADPGPRQNAGWRNAAATTARAVGAAALLNEHNAMDVCHSRRSRESTAAKQCEQQPQQPRAAAAARARHLNFRRTSGPCQFPGQCQAAAPTPSRQWWQPLDTNQHTGMVAVQKALLECYISQHRYGLDKPGGPAPMQAQLPLLPPSCAAAGCCSAPSTPAGPGPRQSAVGCHMAAPTTGWRKPGRD